MTTVLDSMSEKVIKKCKKKYLNWNENTYQKAKAKPYNIASDEKERENW